MSQTTPSNGRAPRNASGASSRAVRVPRTSQNPSASAQATASRLNDTIRGRSNKSGSGIGSSRNSGNLNNTPVRSQSRIAGTRQRAQSKLPRQSPPGTSRFARQSSPLPASSTRSTTRTTRTSSSASTRTRSNRTDRSASALRTAASRKRTMAAAQAPATLVHALPLQSLRDNFQGSCLPTLAQKHALWQNLDSGRIGPHFSPSFRGRRLINAQDEKNRKCFKLQPSALKVIPLGGLCEVGRNMTALEYGNDLILIDCGVSFPDESQPGIDSVIPNMEYVFKNIHKLRALFITHGHEDHIGAISWLLDRVNVPVYTTPLPASLIRYKLEDRGVRGKDSCIHEVRAGDRVRAGCMEVEYIHVNHSIADACALAIRTPVGIVVHTGDFKIDYTPIDGGPIDLPRLAQIGAEGVLLLLCESTNVERSGFSPSERVVGETFAELFSEAQGRIIVATFSSNVYRIQQIIDAAERHNRKVALIGRSMQNVFRAADSLHYIRHNPDTLIDLHQIESYRPEELVIITTGSQGEPMAALTRMAFDSHRSVEINDTDTVIISATPIPGNEKPIYRVINELYKRGAKVIYSSLAHIHVSGHAYREEIKLMHSLIQPRYFIPVHGEYRMLHVHGELAHALGHPWDSIFILNNGDVFQTDGKQAGIVASFDAQPVLIDGKSATTLDNAVLESRRTMAEEGIVVVSLCVDSRTKRLAARPALQTQGFAYASDLRSIENQTIQQVEKYIKQVLNNDKPLVEMLRSKQFTDVLQNLFYQLTQRSPIVLVTVLETGK